jgi:hypothetical protein
MIWGRQMGLSVFWATSEMNGERNLESTGSGSVHEKVRCLIGNGDLYIRGPKRIRIIGIIWEHYESQVRSNLSKEKKQ